MKKILLKKLQIDEKDFIHKAVGHAKGTLLTPPFTAYCSDTGHHLVTVTNLEGNYEALRRSFDDVLFTKSVRTVGLSAKRKELGVDTTQGTKKLARVPGMTVKLKKMFPELVINTVSFGFNVKNALTHTPTGPCAFNRKYSGIYKMIEQVCNEMYDHFRKYAPVEYDIQMKHQMKINQEYHMFNGPHNAGVINKNTSMSTHYDRGNTDGSASCMAVFKRDTVGGDLYLPAYNATVLLPDMCCVIFDGQSILHGVTNCEYTSQKGRRYTLVSFGIKKLANALGVVQEAEAMRLAQRNSLKNFKI